MTIDKAVLRKLASEATSGHWSVQGPWPHATIYAFDNPDLREDVEARHIASSPLILRSDQKCADDADMAFIAAANPQTVLDLLDQFDRADADLERTKAVHEDEIRRLNGGDWLRERSMIEKMLADREVLRSELATCRAALDRAEAECERLRAFEAEVSHPSMTWHNTAAVDALRNDRDEARAQLAAMTAARDEACDSWQAHLTGAIKRCGEDGGYRLEQAHLDAVRSVGQAK